MVNTMSFNIWDKLKPLTPGQEEMMNALRDSALEILGFFGPTGTGKSLFSLSYGIQSVINGNYNRFIIVRPVIDIVSGEEITITKSREGFIEVVKSYIQDLIGGLVECY